MPTDGGGVLMKPSRVQVVKVVERGMRGKRGPPGEPGVGAIDLPLAIDNPQDGDVLSYDTAQAAWKNRPRRNV
ncbi:hypothetical protein ACUSIJ_07730, partial [Pseudochelatococcus sp. B33]